MTTLEEIQTFLHEHPAVMLYFSAPGCNVCHALKPKLADALLTRFDQFKTADIDIARTPEIASHFNVFAIPTVLIFFEGREFIRKSRNMSIEGLMDEIRRPYELLRA